MNMQPTVFQLAIVCAGLLIAAYVLIAVLLFVPATSQVAKQSLPNIGSMTITILLTVGSFTIGGWVQVIFVTVIFARINFEAASVIWHRMPSSIKLNPTKAALLVSFVSLCLLGVTLLMPIRVAILATGLTLLVAAGLAVVLKGKKLGLLFEMIAFPFCPVLIFALAAQRVEYAALALAAYILVETFDSYAFIGGKLWGRHKAFAKLSPRKTVEGLAVGGVMLLLTAGIAGFVLSGTPLKTSLSFAAVTAVLAITGDLAASGIKRRSAVKDYPVVARYQGGLLDVYDSWITTVAGLVLVLLVFSI